MAGVGCSDAGSAIKHGSAPSRKSDLGASHQSVEFNKGEAFAHSKTKPHVTHSMIIPTIAVAVQNTCFLIS
jgi:hypothetical protein